MRKKLLCIILGCVIILTLTSAAGAQDTDTYMPVSNTASVLLPITFTDTSVINLSPAEKLNLLGLMNGYGTLPDGSIDFGLADTITRQEALALLVRTLGHGDESSSNTYAMPFTDVSSWAVGIAGYAYNAGITTGISETLLGAEASITGRDLVTLMLRALGYSSSFSWDNACQASDGIGLTHGQFGDGTEAITRGEAAEVFAKFLSLSFKGESYTVIQFLTDIGAVSSDDALRAGYKVTSNEAVMTAGSVLNLSSSKLLTVTAYDIKGAELGVSYGCFIGNGVGTASLSGIRNAASLKVTASDGNIYDVTGICGYDEAKNLVYFSVDCVSNDYFSGEASEAQVGSVVYVLSSSAATGRQLTDGMSCIAEAGLPAVSADGTFLGITTAEGSLTSTSFNENPMSVMDLGNLLWADSYIIEPEYPRGIDPTKPMVAVTYDDGPHLTHTPELLDLLEEYGVVATFFEVGSRLATMPQFLARMEEMGCEIGNHSYSHTNLAKLSAQGVADEIEKTNAIIREEVGHDATVVRTPGGSVNATVKSTIEAPIISWSVDTLDWKVLKASSVISSVQNTKNLDGAIILMHSLYTSTVTASETIIPWLIEEGYQLVTVSELAEYKGYELENGHVYYSFR